ncbi:hypothetical protein IFM89_010221 [Coptis chinensis]|uniref:DUF4408 domain-containing protein n=1 Tax=Coptis chinensis TaxID=261450 RepID=A0A835GYY4_9MAGN|nr:hypothetical protein IFM89_010221 [Coptis chinensis]
MFMAFILYLYVPVVFEIVVSGVPMLWTTLGLWFTPPYLYVVVNFIIIAIAASSRFQQKIEGVSKVVATTKTQNDLLRKASFEIDTKNSFEYKMELEAIEPEISGHVEVKGLKVKTKKKLRELDVKTKKKPVKSKSAEFEAREPEMYYGYIEVKKVEAAKEKKKPMASKLEFEVNKMEGEDEYASSMSRGMPMNRMDTVEIPMDSIHQQDSFAHQAINNESPKAGKEQRSLETEANDTMEDTWKMIMESRKIQNAGLEGASVNAEKVKTRNNMVSPSQSRKKQDTFRW